jgi:hypothetical protein
MSPECNTPSSSVVTIAGTRPNLYIKSLWSLVIHISNIKTAMFIAINAVLTMGKVPDFVVSLKGIID